MPNTCSAQRMSLESVPKRMSGWAALVGQLGILRRDRRMRSVRRVDCTDLPNAGALSIACTARAWLPNVQRMSNASEENACEETAPASDRAKVPGRALSHVHGAATYACLTHRCFCTCSGNILGGVHSHGSWAVTYALHCAWAPRCVSLGGRGDKRQRRPKLLRRVAKYAMFALMRPRASHGA